MKTILKLVLGLTLVLFHALAQAAEPSVYYIHNDHLGTPRAVTDSNNQVVWRWEGEPFGNTVPDEDPGKTGKPFQLNLRFPGQSYDAETGRHYNYWRDYDPETGRYVQSDPIGLSGGVNTYAYAMAEPISKIDPLGLAYFAKRPLQGLKWLGPLSENPIDDYFNTEFSHEQLFFEDGKSPQNIGFFGDGTLKQEVSPTGYRAKSGKYNDCIMRKAVARTPVPPSYCIIGRNCQTWAEMVRKEYARLINDTKVRKDCGSCE